jgi:hypothetical protein
MAEARKRNPDVFLDCLPWAFPAWVGEPFSQNAADYFAAFLETARKHHGLEIDWLAAAQNELGTDNEWVREVLRPTLEKRGFKNVKLQAPDDDGEFWKIFEDFQNGLGLERAGLPRSLIAPAKKGMADSGDRPRRLPPQSPPSGPAPRLFQESHAKSKFLGNPPERVCRGGALLR